VKHLFDESNGSELYHSFLSTNLASRVSTCDIFTQLCSSLLTHYNTREVQRGDMTDMQMLSNLLPYCHVMTTDKFMKQIVRNLGLDDRFAVRVFSGTVDDLASLAGHLTTLLDSRQPANTPVLSLLVVPNA
jgi:hypothetical protein